MRDRACARARVSALDANARRRTNIDQYTIPNVVLRTPNILWHPRAPPTPRHTMALDAELDAARVYLGVAPSVSRTTDRVVVAHRATSADDRDDADASCDVVVTIANPHLWPNSETTIMITHTRGADDDDAASALAAAIARDAEAFERTEGYLVAVLGAARARARAMGRAARRCAICREAATRETRARLDACWHAFHGACFLKWAKGGGEGGSAVTRPTCPTCRAVASAADVARFERAAAAAAAAAATTDDDDDEDGGTTMIVDAATREALAAMRVRFEGARAAQRSRGGEIDAATAGRGVFIDASTTTRGSGERLAASAGAGATTATATAPTARARDARGARGDERKDSAWLARARGRAAERAAKTDGDGDASR